MRRRDGGLEGVLTYEELLMALEELEYEIRKLRESIDNERVSGVKLHVTLMKGIVDDLSKRVARWREWVGPYPSEEIIDVR